MTPAKRRRLYKTLGIMTVALIVGVLGRTLFLGQPLTYLLLNRKPGSATPGTVLIKKTSALTNQEVQQVSLNSKTTRDESSDNTSENPKKLKFDILTTWKYDEKNPHIPDEVKALDGKYIELTGFMMPINETENITKFIVVNALWGCCFGQAPAVNHVIIVTMEPGKAIDFYPDPITVTGRFSVGETREEGYLVSIFRMQGTKVVVR
jgi:hypothetical protein